MVSKGREVLEMIRRYLIYIFFFMKEEKKFWNTGLNSVLLIFWDSDDQRDNKISGQRTDVIYSWTSGSPEKLQVHCRTIYVVLNLCKIVSCKTILKKNTETISMVDCWTLIKTRLFVSVETDKLSPFQKNAKATRYCWKCKNYQLQGNIRDLLLFLKYFST